MDLVGQTKEKRIALDGEYRRLAHTINALATLGGEAPYKRLMSSINADIQQALLAERPETKKKEPKEPKEPKTPKDPKEPKQPDTPKDPKDPKQPEQPGGEQPKKPDEKPKPGGDDGDPDIHLPEE